MQLSDSKKSFSVLAKCLYKPVGDEYDIFQFSI